MKIKANNYTTIQGWMRTELGLKGTDLIIYAIIYGFSQTEKQWFTGSRQYLADWTGCSVRTVQSTLDRMTAEGFLHKRKGRRNGTNFCDYQTAFKSEKISLSESENISLSKVQNLHHRECKNCTIESAEFAHHNNIYINKHNKDIYNERPSDLSQEFGELWGIYPKRTAKKRAETEYIKARENGADFDVIKNGIEAYIQELKKNRTETKYIKSMANFLKYEAWLDEYETADTRDGYDIDPATVEELISGAI